MFDEFYVMSFDSVSYSMQAEKLAAEKFKIAVIPTPAEITSNCGLSIRFMESNRAVEILEFAREISAPCSLYALSKEKTAGKRHIRRIEVS